MRGRGGGWGTVLVSGLRVRGGTLKPINAVSWQFDLRLGKLPNLKPEALPLERFSV